MAMGHLVLIAWAAAASSLQLPAPAGRPSAVSLGRRAVLPLLPAALLLPTQARAEGDEKKYAACMSTCMYDELKIAKGIGEVEVKPRDEVTAECKVKCKELKPKKVKK